VQESHYGGSRDPGSQDHTLQGPRCVIGLLKLGLKVGPCAVSLNDLQW